MTNLVRALFLSLLLLPGIASAEKLTVALYEGANPPYSVIDESGESGIFIDLFDKIEAITPYKFDLVGYPFARVMVEFDAGRVDIEPGVSESWRQQAKELGVYSISYSVSREVIVFKQGKQLDVSSPQDLYGKSIGLVRGYSYPWYDDAFEAKKIIRIDNLSESLLLKQLLYDRVDQIFIGYRTILYYQKMYPEYRSFVVGNVVGEADVKLRIHPSKAYILPDINHALRQLIEAGEIQKIYDKYR